MDNKVAIWIWVLKSHFKRLTFKRSWWSNLKLIIRCRGTWNLRYNVFITLCLDRQEKRLTRMKRKLKTVTPDLVGEEAYIEAVRGIEEERETTNPTIH